MWWVFNHCSRSQSHIAMLQAAVSTHIVSPLADFPPTTWNLLPKILNPTPKLKPLQNFLLNPWMCIFFWYLVVALISFLLNKLETQAMSKPRFCFGTQPKAFTKIRGFRTGSSWLHTHILGMSPTHGLLPTHCKASRRKLSRT